MGTKAGYTRGPSVGCLPISLLPCAAPDSGTSAMVSSAKLSTLYLVALRFSELPEPIGDRTVPEPMSAAVFLILELGSTYVYTTSRIPPPGPRPIMTISTPVATQVRREHTEHLGSKAPVEGAKTFFGAHLKQAGPRPLYIRVWLAGTTGARQWSGGEVDVRCTWVPSQPPWASFGFSTGPR